MKDFIKNFKIPIILGCCALAAVIVTLFVITGGFSSSYKLNITNTYGKVSVTSADVSAAAANGTELKQGDVITIGANSSCTIAYQGRKNSDKNYFVLGPNTQIVISDKFNGKKDGEIFLRNGTIIANFADDDKASILIRTESCMTTVEKSVAKIAYSTNEFMSCSEIYTFMNNNQIQLYDSIGNTVNTPEYQTEKRWGRVIVSDEKTETEDGTEPVDGPYFDLLNYELDLNLLTAFDLKQLLTIAALIGDDFPYDTEELRAIYELKSSEEENADPITEQTEATTTAETDISDTIQTAVPIETTRSPIETTLPGQTHATTARPYTAATTAKPVQTQADTTSSSSNSGNGTVHIVTIDIDGEETIQEVVHGGNAVRPEDPVIDGLTFIGWDGSFENITQDTVITALFNENLGNIHTVTIVIGDRTSSITVEHGQAAPLPADVNVEGYIFKGWDKDYSSIVSDITITAILERAQTHTVTFVIGNDTFPVQVEHGGSVLPPYIPSRDTGFVGWDKSLGNILSDTTITAVFEDSNYHTVTFIIDNEWHSVQVKHGETAEPPVWPVEDSHGNIFRGWDRSLENITEDVTITAIYGPPF